MQRRVYLDYASITPIDPEVILEVKKYSSGEYANPSSWHKEGVAAKKSLAKARKSVAEFLHSLPDEIVFTSGGTESNNLALLGSIESLRSQGVQYGDMHVVASAIEHASVREVINYLNEKGVRTEAAPVDNDGIVNIEQLKKKIRPNTVIVSIMTVNNEIGTIQPIREIAKVIRQVRKKFSSDFDNKTDSDHSIFDFQSFQYPIFHTDAAQAAIYENLNVQQLGVDLLTMDGSKVYGPRGVGMLYIKRNTPIKPIIFGGGQEGGMRSGTENIPAIMGFVKALELINVEKGKDGNRERVRVQRLKDYFFEGLKKIQPNIVVNPNLEEKSAGKGVRMTEENVQGDGRVVNLKRAANGHYEAPADNLSSFYGRILSPHILNVSIPGINNEFFTMQLDAKGIAVSTKSSCLRDEDESFVLKTIGANSGNSIRFSFGRWTNMAELKRVLAIIGDILNAL